MTPNSDEYQASPPTEVYVVTSGEYSDYGISSVWLTLAEAQAEADTWGRVEVWPIGTNQRSLGSFSRSCDLDGTTGEVLNEQAYDAPDLDEHERVSVCCWPDSKPGSWSFNRLGVRVHSPTQERADKVFSEIKARVLADISTGLPVRSIAEREYVNNSWREIPRD